MSLRVLHAPGIAGGNAAELARAERMLGLDSHCVAFDANPMGYEVDECVTPGAGRLRFEWARWRWLWRAWREFDVIHFNFGQSLMPQYLPSSGDAGGHSFGARMLYRVYARRAEMFDIAFLKARGKAVFMTYQGDDARQGDYCRANFAVTFADRVEPGYYTAESDAAKRRRIAVVNRHVDGIFALNPDLLHVLPSRARFLPYANVDLRRWKDVGDARNAVPVIVHAPSHSGVKGTDLVIDAVARLRERGHRFEFVLVQGRSRGEAMEIYRGADLCIDQLFAGWYGGLAVEMMAMGKPVAAYLREEDLNFLPAEMRDDVPIVRVTPSGLVDELDAWLRRPPQEWRRTGAAGRRFVERWHDPLKIAAQMRQAYQDAPASARD